MSMSGADFSFPPMGILIVLAVVALALALLCSKQLERQTEGLWHAQFGIAVRL